MSVRQGANGRINVVRIFPTLNVCQRSERRIIRILRAYWFTASTSFANPAVTVARAFTDTFAGIRPVDVPGFVIVQVLGALTATLLFRWLVPTLPQNADDVVAPRLQRTS